MKIILWFFADKYRIFYHGNLYYVETKEEKQVPEFSKVWTQCHPTQSGYVFVCSDWLRVAVSLSTIMGITWISGIVIFHSSLVALAYVFTIFVAFQVSPLSLSSDRLTALFCMWCHMQNISRFLLMCAWQWSSNAWDSYTWLDGLCAWTQPLETTSQCTHIKFLLAMWKPWNKGPGL